MLVSASLELDAFSDSIILPSQVTYLLRLGDILKLQKNRSLSRNFLQLDIAEVSPL